MATKQKVMQWTSDGGVICANLRDAKLEDVLKIVESWPAMDNARADAAQIVDASDELIPILNQRERTRVVKKPKAEKKPKSKPAAAPAAV